mmetsp:Transcript_2385/g.3469  ORF Transcript_2385/g.3469 Transcript_2385/m.3469 type:complete len:449 (+) Transcript_2385:30-1376(+)
MLSNVEAPLKVIFDEMRHDPQFTLSGVSSTRILHCHYFDKPHLGFEIDPVLQPYHDCIEKKLKKRSIDQKEHWHGFFKKTGGESKAINFNKHERRIKNLIRNYGIPPEFRSKVWLECVGVHKKIDLNRGYYDKMLDSDLHDSKHHTIIHQIELDLRRTFPKHPFFKHDESNTPLGLVHLRHVLLAFSRRNPYIAYCQALNYIAGYLLLHFVEEEAFWMLVMLLEEILPGDYYNPKLRGVRVDTKVLDHLISFYLPTIHRHFKKCEFDVSAIVISWFLRLYVEVFPVNTTLRIWDLIFNEGSKMLFRVVLGMLKINKQQVLKCHTPGELLTCLNNAGKRQFDHDELIKACFSFHKLKNITIDLKREYFASIIDAEQESIETRRQNQRNRIQYKDDQYSYEDKLFKHLDANKQAMDVSERKILELRANLRHRVCLSATSNDLFFSSQSHT